MNKVEVQGKLQSFRDRLENDVIPAYAGRGSSFGTERFSAWRTLFSKFLDANLPGTTAKLDAKLDVQGMLIRGGGESDVSIFMRRSGEKCFAFIDSLRIDVENDEFDFSSQTITETQDIPSKPLIKNNRCLHRSWS